MTKSEKDIILAINTEEDNETVNFINNGLFIEKNGISQNFAVILDNYIIVRVDNNCKGLYKKIFNNHDKINKKILIGTDIISKLIINKLTIEDAEEMLVGTFKYCGKHLLYIFEKNYISLKNILYDTAIYFDIEYLYIDYINQPRGFDNLLFFFKENYNWITMKSTTPEIIKKEYIIDEWLADYNFRNRNDTIKDLLEEE